MGNFTNGGGVLGAVPGMAGLALRPLLDEDQYGEQHQNLLDDQRRLDYLKQQGLITPEQHAQEHAHLADEHQKLLNTSPRPITPKPGGGDTGEPPVLGRVGDEHQLAPLGQPTPAPAMPIESRKQISGEYQTDLNKQYQDLYAKQTTMSPNEFLAQKGVIDERAAELARHPEHVIANLPERGVLGKIGHAFAAPFEQMKYADRERGALGEISEATKGITEEAAAKKAGEPEKGTKDWGEISGGAIDPKHPELGVQPAFYSKEDPSQGIVFGNVPAGKKAQEPMPGSQDAVVKSLVGQPDPKHPGQVFTLDTAFAHVKEETTKPAAEKNPMSGLDAKGKPIYGYPQKGGVFSTDPEGNNPIDGFKPAPTYASMVPERLATQTKTLFGPDGKPHDYSWNNASAKYDIDQGLSTAGVAGGREAQANVIAVAGANLIHDIETSKEDLGTLTAWYKSHTLNVPYVGDPKLAEVDAELRSFAALQPAMHGFRSTSALETFEKIIGGLAKNPEATIGSIRGILKTAGAVGTLPETGEEKKTDESDPYAKFKRKEQ
jgi:hypothetical protein